MRRIKIWMKDGNVHVLDIHREALSAMTRQIYRKEDALWCVQGIIFRVREIDGLEEQ